MKTLIAALFLFSSMNAFANPFDTFEGTYIPQGEPEIVAGGNYCNWMNFRAITAMKLEKNEMGVFHFVLSSLQNNSPLSISWDFQEYEVMDEMGTSNSGVLSGESGSAQYRVRNSTPESLEVYQFGIQQSENGLYRLSLVYQNRDRFSGLSACNYQVALKKQ